MKHQATKMVSSLEEFVGSRVSRGIAKRLNHVRALNRAFTTWVEDEDHQREHRSLGMRPIDRFGIDLSRIRFLPPGDVKTRYFFVEQDRTVNEGSKPAFGCSANEYACPKLLLGKVVHCTPNPNRTRSRWQELTPAEPARSDRGNRSVT